MADQIDFTNDRMQLEASTIGKRAASYLEANGGNSTGICENCDIPIPDTRLAAIPTAKYCVKCQTLADDGKL